MPKRKVVDLVHRKSLPEAKLAKVLESMRNEEINTDGFSDVIIRAGLFFEYEYCDQGFAKKLKNDKYLNLMTDKYGKIDSVIRKNKRFLHTLISSEEEIGQIEGICIVPAKTFNALIIAIFMLEQVATESGKKYYRWKEKKNLRTFVSSEYILPGQDTCDYFNSKVFDVYGQAAYVDLDGFLYLFDNFLPHIKRTVLKYFGGLVVERYDSEDHAKLHTLYSIENTLFMLYDIIKNDYSVCSKQAYVSTAILKFGDFGNLGSVNKTAKSRMFQYVNNEISERELELDDEMFVWDEAELFNNNNEKDFPFSFLSYLQKVESGYVERFFYPVILEISVEKETDVVLVEVQQVKLDEKSYEARIHNFKSLPVYREKPETETPFGITAKYTVDKFINMLTKKCKEKALGSKTFASNKDICKEFGTRTNMASWQIVPYAVSMSQDNVVERILKVDGMNGKTANAIIKSYCLEPPFHAGSLYHIVGNVDRKAKTLDKVLLLPNGMLSYVINERIPLYLIKKCKELFEASDESRQYFMRMDDKSYQYLISRVQLYNDWGQDAFILLNKLDGHMNWKGHISHLEKHGLNIQKYRNYLFDLDNIREKTDIKFDWKVSGESLEKAYRSAEKLFMMLNDTENVKWAEKFFTDSQEKWKALEYESDEFVIVAPKDPYDVVTEGVELRHCVKDFIDTIVKGEATILFIRQREKPEKPFFTIEIRKGFIRQCHGFNNANAVGNLLDFLKEYAEKKKLDLNNKIINNLLGPN